jgi:hypothetical protein
MNVLSRGSRRRRRPSKTYAQVFVAATVITFVVEVATGSMHGRLYLAGLGVAAFIGWLVASVFTDPNARNAGKYRRPGSR